MFAATARSQTGAPPPSSPANIQAVLVITNGVSYDTNSVFKLYSCTNLSASNWTLFASFPATQTNYTFAAVVQQQFVRASVSNFWGELFFCNVVELPAPPSSTNSVLQLLRAW